VIKKYAPIMIAMMATGQAKKMKNWAIFMINPMIPCDHLDKSYGDECDDTIPDTILGLSHGFFVTSLD
jgi:hypothetical protein